MEIFLVIVNSTYFLTGDFLSSTNTSLGEQSNPNLSSEINLTKSLEDPFLKTCSDVKEWSISLGKEWRLVINLPKGIITIMRNNVVIINNRSRSIFMTKNLDL